jgi:putative DNA primase/helicase
MITIEELTKIKPETYPRNDIGSSNLFHTLYCDVLRYVPERKSFMMYDGKVWVKDMDDLQAHEYAKDFAVSMLNYANSLNNENRDEIIKYYAKYLNRPNRKKLIDDVKGIYPLSVDVFDKKAYLFNCQNATVNLITGMATPHDPEDYLSKISNVRFDPDAKSEEWERFVQDIMLGDQELIQYLQKCLGYSISAATFQECFFTAYGKTTRNGKGTLDGTMQHMLGDYAKAAAPETFESKRYKSSSGSEDVARLAGARYVSVYEPSEGMTLDSSLIKAMSGNDKITARFLYENSFEFVSSFKIWLFTNHLPNITDDSVFRSNRVLMVPFNRHFSEEEQDRGLKSRLQKQENISGIFNWCMEGFQKLGEEGKLTIPEKVKKDIERYRQSNDRLGEFLNECYTNHIDGIKHREKLSVIYKAYCKWCIANNYKVLNKKNFKEKLGEKVQIERYIGQDHALGIEPSEGMPPEWLI